MEIPRRVAHPFRLPQRPATQPSPPKSLLNALSAYGRWGPGGSVSSEAGVCLFVSVAESVPQVPGPRLTGRYPSSCSAAWTTSPQLSLTTSRDGGTVSSDGNPH